jgi:hypothetical protein
MLFVRICKDDGILLAPQTAVAPLLLPAKAVRRGRDAAAGAASASGGVSEVEGKKEGAGEMRGEAGDVLDAALDGPVGERGSLKLLDMVPEPAKV